MTVPLRADLVTVYHNDTNYEQHHRLFDAIRAHEPGGGYRLIGVDNRVTNRGFAAACNLGALHHEERAPIIGFLNPDTDVQGPFLQAVTATLKDPVVITGCRFGKPDRELRTWGVHDWVCGAVLFVRRGWFESAGGFDEQFVWSHEETDLIRRAEAEKLRCQPINLPLRHESPTQDDPADATYKQFQFGVAQKRYSRKWRTR